MIARLVQALLNYVPVSDPRLKVVWEIGNYCKCRSADLHVVGESLCQEFVGTQLRDVIRRLRELLRYLPQE